MLWDILHDPDPERSDLTIGVYLCNKNGAELMGTDKNGNPVSKGHIGSAKLCLKDMVREQEKDGSGSVQLKGMVEMCGIIGIIGKESMCSDFTGSLQITQQIILGQSNQGGFSDKPCIYACNAVTCYHF